MSETTQQQCKDCDGTGDCRREDCGCDGDCRSCLGTGRAQPQQPEKEEQRGPCPACGDTGLVVRGNRHNTSSEPCYLCRGATLEAGRSDARSDRTCEAGPGLPSSSPLAKETSSAGENPAPAPHTDGDGDTGAHAPVADSRPDLSPSQTEGGAETGPEHSRRQPPVDTQASLPGPARPDVSAPPSPSAAALNHPGKPDGSTGKESLQVATAPRREVVLVLNTFGEPERIDDGNAWDAGKRRVIYVPAEEAERERQERLQRIIDDENGELHSKLAQRNVEALEMRERIARLEKERDEALSTLAKFQESFAELGRMGAGSPAQLRRLLAERDEARAQAEQLRQRLAEWHATNGGLEMKDQLDAARAEAESARREMDEAREKLKQSLAREEVRDGICGRCDNHPGMCCGQCRQEVAAAKAEAESARRERDEAKLAYSHLKAHHVDAECGDCGEKDCPYGETLHYHHDECPAEWAENQKLRKRLEELEQKTADDPYWAERSREKALEDAASALRKRCEELEDGLRDIAEHGCRHDLLPTKSMPVIGRTWDYEQANRNELWWHDWIRSMDEAVRATARRALIAAKGEPGNG